MTTHDSPSPCPSCAGAIRLGRAAKILGGVPTPADIMAAARPHAERTAAGAALTVGESGERGAVATQPRRREAGPLRCASCDETLYQAGPIVLKHRGAPPMIPMWVAADRLRNHLRRLAITRLGRIDGDCYLLPFIRFEGKTPEGDETFTLLGASIGEERLEATFLPPADLRPYKDPDEGAAGAAGEGSAAIRVLPMTLSFAELRKRAEARGWEATRPVEIIHYPFWLMRVEDCGKLEGAWMDGIEGKQIHHRMRLTPPVPSLKKVAAWALLVALVAGALAAVAFRAEPGVVAALGAGVGVWLAGAPVLHAALHRSWRG